MRIPLSPRPPDGTRIVILSGAGLSVASGIPTFRGADGLWEGHRPEEVATPEAWERDAELVRRFYDTRRVNMVHVTPNPAHEALCRFQHRWGGPDRVALVTQNVDGLLHKAAAADVLEMHGSLWYVRCERDESHPHIQIAGKQNPDRRCAICKAVLRPDVVWFGEVPRYLERIEKSLSECGVFISIGTSGTVFPASNFVRSARRAGAHCIEINPVPTGGPFHQTLAGPAEELVPRLVAEWLDEPE